jgi:integrase
MVFSRLADQYLRFAERRYAKATFKYKFFVYSNFIRHQGDISITEITPDIIHNYLDSRPSNNNYNVHRKDLSALFSWAKSQLRLNIHNPCAELEKMPHEHKRKRTPTEKEILSMLAAAAPGDELDIFMACLQSLGRIDEILRLTWEDINFDKRTITLWTRKRKSGEYESDVLPMNEDLYSIMKKRWKDKKQNKWVFYNKNTNNRFFHRPKMMSSICSRAKIDPIGKGMKKETRGKNKGKMVEHDLYYGFHDLRHFMATYLSDAEKVSLKTTSGLLRHKNLKTTEIYLHPVDESQRRATTKIEGKFTQKNEYPLTIPSHIKEQGVTNNS